MYELSQLAVCLLFVLCTIKYVHIYIIIIVTAPYDACLFWTVANLVSYVVPDTRLYGARTLCVRGVYLYNLSYIILVLMQLSQSTSLCKHLFHRCNTVLLLMCFCCCLLQSTPCLHERLEIQNNLTRQAELLHSHTHPPHQSAILMSSLQ